MNTTVEMINKLKEVLIPLADKLKDEASDIYSIKNEARNLELKNRELRIINEQIIKQNEDVKAQAENIIKSAKIEADSLLKIANDNIIMAHKESEMAKKIVQDAKSEADLIMKQAAKFKVK